jgi:hypothetical protein
MFPATAEKIAPITNATTNSYTIPTNEAGTKYYYVVVTGSCASNVTSNIVSQVVNSSTFTTDVSNADQNLAFGGTATPWTSYTPTLTNITLGNGTLDFKHKQIGKTVFVRGTFTMGSTSSMSTGPTFTLPVTAVTYSDRLVVGTCGILDSGTEQYYGAIALTSTTVASCRVYNAASTYLITTAISSTAPMTWTTNDMLTVNFNYEAA